MLSMRTVKAEAEQLNFPRKSCHGQLQQLEIEICQTLSWRLNVPTPIEFSKLLLYQANSGFDFRHISFKVNSLIFLCLLGNQLFCNVLKTKTSQRALFSNSAL